MSPVQEGSVVVYVIDNSGSLEPHKEALFDAFDDLTGRASLPNVQLAAVKHGYSQDLRAGLPRRQSKRSRTACLLSVRRTIPWPIHYEEKLYFNYGITNSFYSAIMAAWEMIKDECPPGVDLDVKPWCERKVIMALGDGDPGVSPMNADDFPQPYADAFLPTNLLSGLQKAGIRVDTLCVGRDVASLGCVDTKIR